MKYGEGRLLAKEEKGSDSTAVIDLKFSCTSSTKLLRNNHNNIETIGEHNVDNVGCGACRHANLDGQRAEMFDGSCNSGVNDQRTYILHTRLETS